MRVVKAGTRDDWAKSVAETVIARVQANPALKLCLPTGLTPVPIYDRIAAAVAAGRVSLRHAAVFLLDEFGGVAPEDPGRCDQMLLRALIGRIDLPTDHFHRFNLERDLDAECERYERAIGGGCDLTLLGIGGNGHIGMNEPGSAADSLTRRVDLAPSTIEASARYFSHDQLPTWGVTMGVATIMRSGEVWLLAAGAGKADIVRRTVREPISEALPASLLRRHPCTLLIVDDEAGAHLAAHQVPSAPGEERVVSGD